MFDSFIRWRKQEIKDSVWPFSAGMRFIGGSGEMKSISLKHNHRWEDNQRTMVVYKESQELAKKDPKLDVTFVP